MAIGGAEWWKWALSVPLSQSPITDPDGEFGSQNQTGSVWFLAGNFGGTSERSITIPAGKSIFFPLINIWNDWPCPDPNFKPGPGQTLEEFLAAGAAPYIDVTNALSARVDGVELQNLFNYRGVSKLTTFTADPTQIAIDPCITGDKQYAVSDGYWIMLTPLTPGKHTIQFSSATTTGFSLDVTYHVTVKK